LADPVSNYWEYELIASVYNGFNFKELQGMTVRQRRYWYEMAKWRSNVGG
jgi:hypothetical protein